MEKAYLEILDGPDKNKRLPVRFNPQSLQVNYHTVGPKGSKQRQKDGEKQGARDQQTGALADIAMDLIFDTSEEGKDVCKTTVKIAALINPELVYGKSAPPPPRVRFHWGTFVFNGKVLSVSETIDFFSEQGVPLRSTVKLSMSEVQRERGNPGVGGGAGAGAGASAGIGFSASAGVSAGVGADIGFSASASLSAGIDIGTTPLTLAQAGDSLQALAGRAGVGASWKAIAAANNIDNPRSIVPGTPINLSAGASASASVSFDGGTASATASAGASASFGAGS